MEIIDEKKEIYVEDAMNQSNISKLFLKIEHLGSDGGNDAGPGAKPV